jgi:hypothetical protein
VSLSVSASVSLSASVSVSVSVSVPVPESVWPNPCSGCISAQDAYSSTRTSNKTRFMDTSRSLANALNAIVAVKVYQNWKLSCKKNDAKRCVNISLYIGQAAGKPEPDEPGASSQIGEDQATCPSSWTTRT